MTFEEVSNEWMNEKKLYLKEATFDLYLYELHKYVLPELGMLNIEDVDMKQLQNFANVLQNGLKKTTISNILSIVKRIMHYSFRNAYAESYIIEITYGRNVDSVAEFNKNKKYTYETQNLIIKSVFEQPTNENIGIALSLLTGMRVGEICALQWKDINLSEGMMTISKTLQRVYNIEEKRSKIIITPPKTLSSIRCIPLPQKICEILMQISHDKEENYVLTNSRKYMEPRTYRRYYRKYLLEHGIKEDEILRFHSLRHTFATNCIEYGASYKCVSELLGHASINTTMNCYVHPGIKEKRQCLEKLTNF